MVEVKLNDDFLDPTVSCGGTLYARLWSALHLPVLSESTAKTITVITIFQAVLALIWERAERYTARWAPRIASARR